jgi:dipicolinate synthase subunit A
MKSNNETFAIIGGDKRNFYLAEALKKDGYTVNLWGFDKLNNNNCEIASALDSDILILPIVPFTENKKVNSPYSEKTVDLKDYEGKIKNKKIFTGKPENFAKEFPNVSKSDIISYTDREEFSVKNAVPTAEGAIGEAMKYSDTTINGSKILVCGYGRIGKVLSEMLRGLGGEVTISARRKSDFAWIRLNGFNCDVTGNFNNIDKYSIIFNTVPSLIFNKDILSDINKNTLIIDLASNPGGVDFKAADSLGIKAIQALALPGKTFPKSAGEIMESTILGILEEDDG